MSVVRKRCRKSKLEVRDDDSDYEVVNEEYDDETKPHLQGIKRTNSETKLEHPQQKRVKLEPKLEYKEPCGKFDHDYCKRGYQGFACSYKPIFSTPNASLRGSTIIAVQHTQSSSGLDLAVKVEIGQFDKHGRERLLLPEKRKYSILRKMESQITENNTNKKQKKSIKICKYDPELTLKVSKQISLFSGNLADYLLDIEMRNLWGHVLNTNDEVSEHEAIIQKALETWQIWHTAARQLRDSPLFYQCHICNISWWNLHPFREHIKTHDTKLLKVTLKEMVHECMLIASYTAVTELKFIDNNQECSRCGQGVEFHKHNTQLYICAHCQRCQYTCSALRQHESTCLYSNINLNIINGRQCTICKCIFNSLSLVKKHMLSLHSVRSDIPVAVAFKKCSSCNCKYFTYSTHNCSRSPKNCACDHCCRKFATKQLAFSHMCSKFNREVVCKICLQPIKTKCLEMQHLQSKHSDKYEMAYRCTICSDQSQLFIDEVSIRMHRHIRHQKKSDKRRSCYEMIMLPKQCLQESHVQESFQTEMETSEPPSARGDDNRYDEDFSIPNTSTEPTSLRRLTSDVDLTVDKVYVKREPVEYNENGETDYEEMLNSMFNENNDMDLVSRKIKKTISSEEVLIPTEEVVIPTEEFDWNVQVKSEPIDIDITEHPVGNVEVKMEPIDEPDEFMEYQHESTDIQNDKNHDQSECYNQSGNMNKNQSESCNQSKNMIKNQSEGYNQSKNMAKNQIKVYNRSENMNKNQSEGYNQSGNMNKNQSEGYNQSENMNKNQSKNDNQEEIETLTVKIEPGIDMNDIDTENIVIKNEIVSDDEKSRSEITTEAIPFDQLITDLDMFKSGASGDMNWVSEKVLNPDEMSFDMINPSGIYKKKRIYACHKCGYTAQHKQYRVHVASKCSVSPGINMSHSCTKCGLTFVMFRNYVLHFDTHGYDVLTCPKCDLKFDTFVKLLSHVQKHIKHNFVGIHVLDKGGKESTRDMKKVKCHSCQEVIPQVEMFAHWESHLTLKKVKAEKTPEEPEVKEEPAELTVDCERVTINNKTLEPTALKAALDHLQSNNINEKECVICYRAFARRYDVKRHVVEHLLMDAHMKKAKYSVFRCQICFQGFERQETYKFHMRDHGSMPIFKCELCDKTFSDSSNFAKHKKTHNVRVLICDLCSKKFHSKSALEKHIVEHKNLPKSKCTYCDKVFPNKQSYKRHKYQIHVKNKFKCVLCDLSFHTLQHKWNHNWEVHKERKQAADCPICLKSFRKFHDVRLHAREEHGAEVCVIKQARRRDVQFYKVKNLTQGEMLVVRE